MSGLYGVRGAALALAAAVPLAFLAACSPSQASPAQAAVCGSAVIANLSVYDQAIDNANVISDTEDDGHPHHLTAQMRGELAAAARQLRDDAASLPAGALATDLGTEAGLFANATQGPGGYTSNQLATDTDTTTGKVLGDC
jgi:hypothetical protein